MFDENKNNEFICNGYTTCFIDRRLMPIYSIDLLVQLLKMLNCRKKYVYVGKILYMVIT